MLSLQAFLCKPRTTFLQQKLTDMAYSIPREVMQGRDVRPRIVMDVTQFLHQNSTKPPSVVSLSKERLLKH
jgi:hypothetical protein